MRTAEEIYHAYVQYERSMVSETLKSTILLAINKARVETIKECAKTAIAYMDVDNKPCVGLISFCKLIEDLA